MVWPRLSAWLLAGGMALGQGVTPRPLPQDLVVRSWGKAEGLPDDSVTTVLQSRDGYLWVGTLRGLARFDGVNFEQMGPQGGTTGVGLHVTALAEDSAGRLWIGTQGDGLFCYTNREVRRFLGGKLTDRIINCIAEDTAGNLWVGTPMGLDRIGTNGVCQLTSKDGLPSDFVSSIYAAHSGTIWITTRGGLCRYEGGRLLPFGFQPGSLGRSPEFIGVWEDRLGNRWAFGDTYLVNLAEGKQLNLWSGGTSSMRIWSLCEDHSGQLWVGTSGQGIFCFVGDKFQPLNLPAGQLFSDVRALCEDWQGNLWLGTYGGGIVRLQPRGVRLLDPDSGLPPGPVACMAVGPKGRVWMGFEHAGLFTGSVERFERSPIELGIGRQNLISSLAFGPDASLWVGTWGLGLFCFSGDRTIRYDTANGLSDLEIMAVVAETNQTVWVSTGSGGLHRIAHGVLTRQTVGAGLSGQGIGVLLAARGGGIWLGTEGGGVVRGDAAGFRRIDDRNVFAGQSVRALYEDEVGRLWAGGSAGSLAVWSGGQWLRFEPGIRPGGNGIFAILGDQSGDLCLGASRGLYRLSAKDLPEILAGRLSPQAELLLEFDPVGGADLAAGGPRGLCAPDGRFWFAAGTQVATFAPRELIPRSRPLRVFVEEIRVDGRSLPPWLPEEENARATTKARLPSNLRKIEIRFAAPAFVEPEKIRFRHKLEGFDADWVDDRAVGWVGYGRLPPGAYQFRIKARDPMGIWNEPGAELGFFIPAPVWSSWWALSLYALGAVVAVAGIVRWVSYRRLRRRLARLAQQEAMHRERMRIAQDMHDEIGSKLTKISFMSERAKGELKGQELVAAKLDSISLTSRDLLQSLDEIVWAVNPHNDTLEHLAAYLGQYATEYLQNTAVECELHIERGLPDFPLSAEVRHNVFLAFEEALNNALKHARAARVRVDMAVARSQFEIIVRDDGCGFDPTASAPANGSTAHKRGGNGLSNLHQRLAEVGGRCELSSRPGQGTRVSLTVPLTPPTNP